MYSATIFLILRALSNLLFFYIASCVCFIDIVSFIALKILNIDFCLFSSALCFTCLFVFLFNGGCIPQMHRDPWRNIRI